MPDPARPEQVDQLRHTRDAINVTRELIAELRELKKTVLDNTEAMDALREKVEELQTQLSGVEVDITQKTEDPPPGGEA